MAQTIMTKTETIGFDPYSFTDKTSVGWEFNPKAKPQDNFMVSIQTVAKQFLDDPAGEVDRIREGLPINNVMVFENNAVRRTEAGKGGGPRQHPTQGIVDGTDVFDRLEPILEERDLSLTLGMGESSWGYQPYYAPYSPIAQVDCFGRIHRESCMRNPEWLNFQASSIEEVVRMHPWIGSIMFMHERRGPLASLVFGGAAGVNEATCFCRYCQQAGNQRGIDVERAREGYKQVHALVSAAKADDPTPPSGWFIAFWRLLMEYPEILAWDNLWWDGLHDYRAALAGSAKMVKPDISVGCHIQNAALLNNFLWRAGANPARIAEYSDWLKPSVYMGASLHRANKLTRSGHGTIFKDMNPDVVRDFLMSVQGHKPETYPDKSKGSTDPYPPEWVRTEIERYRKSQPRPVMSGFGIGVPPSPEGETPELITAGVDACFEGGASGILFSREYTEMKPELLAAARGVIEERLDLPAKKTV
mgnify:CR=1 FL=1